MKKFRKLTAIVLVFLMLLSTTAFAGENLKYIESSEEAKFFDQISSDLVKFYHFDITKEEILERTLKNLLNDDPEALDSFLRALFASLDEYSQFYSPEEYEEFARSLENVGGGVGIKMTKETQYVKVVTVLDNHPAAKAGVMEGDFVVKVDGEDMSGKSSDYVSSKVRGEIGTTVKLTLLRNGELIELDVERGELEQSSISYAILDKGVGYLYIESFTSETDKEVEAALKEFDKNGVKKIILDLRYNFGGYLEVAVEVAKRFVPAGTIVTHEMKYGKKSIKYTSSLSHKKYELVTLVNEYTASAAELLASALQESGASKLVGKRTHGKAVTQSILGIYGGRMCKVTTGEYITRKGNKINKVGIKPDYKVHNPTVKFYLTDAEPMKFALKYEKGYKGEELYAIRQRLDALGYDVGDFEAEYDEKLIYAVTAFQRDNGLEATGVMDINTQIVLSNLADEVDVLIDNQLAKALSMFNLEYTGLLLSQED